MHLVSFKYYKTNCYSPIYNYCRHNIIYDNDCVYSTDMTQGKAKI